MFNEWWGYSQQHGWVVLDRTIKCNTPGARGNLLFVRCNDSQAFDLLFELWNPPQFVFAKQYFASLPTPLQESARQELEKLQARWPKYREALHVEVERRQDRLQVQAAEAHASRVAARTQRDAEFFIRARSEFFFKLGQSDPGTRPAQALKMHRVTHCYSCKSSLDNATDAECLACNWIVCFCGACGCGYSR